MNRLPIRAWALFCFVAAAGCGGSGEPPSDEQHGEDFLRCAKPRSDGTKTRFRLPPLTIEQEGHDLTIQGIKRGLVVFGVISGITEPTEMTLRNVDFFLGQFKAAGVQAILIPGGIAAPRAHVDAVLDRLAAAPVPILLCPGALENFDVLRQAVAVKRKNKPQLIDMTKVRRVRIGNVTIVSLPGYQKAFYLNAGSRGCAYTKEDLRETVQLFEASRTNIILSPTPPRGSGEGAVDRGRGGINLGDPALKEALNEAGVRYGLFGYVYESGGHATLMDGFTAAAPAVWHESLYLQAGSAESVPITLTGGGRSVGMAHVFDVSGARARYRTITAPANRIAPSN